MRAWEDRKLGEASFKKGWGKAVIGEASTKRYTLQCDNIVEKEKQTYRVLGRHADSWAERAGIRNGREKGTQWRPGKGRYRRKNTVKRLFLQACIFKLYPVFCPISKPHPPLSPTANEQVEKQLTPWPQQTLPSSESSMAKVTQASEELQWDCGGARVECLVCPYYRDWAAPSVHLAWPPGSLKNRGGWVNSMMTVIMLDFSKTGPKTSHMCCFPHSHPAYQIITKVAIRL